MEAMVLVLCAKTPRSLIRTLSARKLPSALLQGRLPSVEALKLFYVDFNFDSFDYLHRLFFIFTTESSFFLSVTASSRVT